MVTLRTSPIIGSLCAAPSTTPDHQLNAQLAQWRAKRGPCRHPALSTCPVWKCANVCADAGTVLHPYIYTPPAHRACTAQIVPNPDFIGALMVGITYALMVRIVNHGTTKHRVRLEEVGTCDGMRWPPSCVHATHTQQAHPPCAQPF
ncbi:hypothetical protein EON67_03440 [archaeon]|nr:MAG: hypothetical protein EON67_03440 [archaeon]